MIFYLFHLLGYSCFDSVKLRAVLAALTGLVIVLALGRPMIAWLKALKYGQAIRTDGPQSHLQKSGTPTMGGIVIIIAIIVATLLWAKLTVTDVWLALLVLLGFAGIGGRDDYLKIKYKNAKGISARAKFLLQSLVALVVAAYLYLHPMVSMHHYVFIPFTSKLWLPLGAFFIVWVWLLIVGSSNAVNLTDGLDGLAIMPIIMIATALCLLAYLGGHGFVQLPFAMPPLTFISELAIVCAATAGAGLGFLWFNAYPAQVFMGDVGSLSLGGMLGAIALMIHQELVFAIMGGIFILETVSVILQVGSYKLRKKRIFKMAPIHHHFELKGWPEPKVIVRFWIISAVLVLIGLSSLL